MPLNIVKLGTTFTTDAQFYDENGNPFAPKSPASYVVKDFNNNLIVSGLAAQDGLYPETWHATITLPDNAPYSNNQKYSIVWKLTGNNSSTASFTEFFNIIPSDNTPLPEDLNSLERELVIAQGDSISDSLFLPADQTISTYTIRILDDIGNVYGTETITGAEPMDVQGQNMYAFVLDPIDDLTTGYRPYVIEWSYSINGRARKQYHFLYVVNTRVLILMDRLNNLINKAKFNHPNPNLRYNEVDLVASLLTGCSVVNYAAPVFTSFRLDNFPRELEYFLVYSAAYEILSAQYLAEGVSAFEFGGQSVNLTVDRTQSIDSALQRITDVVRTELPKAKTLIAKSSVTGVLTITPSPSSNPRFFTGFGFDQGFPGDYVSRSLLYANIIGRYDSAVTDTIGY